MQTILAYWGWIVFSGIGIALASEYYSSLAHMRNAVARTDDLLKYLDWYADSELVRIQELRHAVHTMRNSDQYYDVEHPVDAYKLIDRITHLTKLTDNSQNVKKLKGAVSNRSIPFMLDTDRKGAAVAISRLLSVYNLSIEELPLIGRPATHLEAKDMLYIGIQAVHNADITTAVSWFSTALTMFEPDPGTRSEIFQELARAHYLAGDTRKTIETIENGLYFDPESSVLAENLNFYQNKMAEQEGNPGHPEALAWVSQRTNEFIGKADTEIAVRYQALCRGDAEMIANQTSFYCHFRKTRYPYIRVKEELLSLDPRISILYDVISETDQQALINFARPQLFRSNVGGPGEQTSTESRVSKLSWLWDHRNEHVKRLSERIALYTGLHTQYREKFSYSEALQVNNYGLGGQYEPHTDYFEDRSALQNISEHLQGSGERMATYMLYLTDVQAGGATVFPLLNVRIPPVKGAAAFWYNIKRSGETDRRTLHAGCPVLVGEKWVANKWIREFGQDVFRPCGLSEEATD